MKQNQRQQNAPQWIRITLIAAAFYNLSWGVFTVLSPSSVFAWLGMPAPLYPELWQGIGMLFGVYGIGFAIASRDPFRHWPIVLVGLSAKVLGPIGLAIALAKGRLDPGFGWLFLFNDLVWWIPLAAILWKTAENQNDSTEVSSYTPEESEAVLSEARTQTGEDLWQLSNETPIMVVFLRHFGCTFCREAITELAEKRKAIEAAGTEIVFVHMSHEKKASAFFSSYGLGDVSRVSDPKGTIYRTFNLRKGKLGQLFGLKVMKRGMDAGLVKGHGIGRPEGDIRQMPGVFLIYRGEIMKSFRHLSAGDRPDYTSLADMWPFNLGRSFGFDDLSSAPEQKEESVLQEY